VLWLTAIVVFAVRLRKLWKLVATKLLTAAVTAVATAAVQSMLPAVLQLAVATDAETHAVLWLLP